MLLLLLHLLSRPLRLLLRLLLRWRWACGREDFRRPHYRPHLAQFLPFGREFVHHILRAPPSGSKLLVKGARR